MNRSSALITELLDLNSWIHFPTGLFYGLVSALMVNLVNGNVDVALLYLATFTLAACSTILISLSRMNWYWVVSKNI
jgi:hypothetical protein